MKIVFLTGSIFNLGGIQRVVTVIANELSKEHEVEVLCTSNKFPVDRKLYGLNENIKVILEDDFKKINPVTKVLTGSLRKLNKKTGIINNSNLLPIMKMLYTRKETKDKFIKFISENKYDIVIGVEGELSLILGSIKEQLSCKTIGWQHNSYEAYFETKNKYYYNQSVVYSEFINKLDNYIVLTEHDKRKLKENLGVKSTTIYNPLSFKSKEKAKLKNKKLISVGRLAKQQKGFDLLLKAFKIVLDKHKDWSLSIVGDGPDKNELVKLSEELGISSSVNFKESTNNIKSEYLDSTIYVSSSRWEGFGLVITEAMECGLPVVAFENSGPKEIITSDKNGLLVERENIKKLASSIIYLIENEKKRERIALSSIERANDFNIENIMSQWNEIVELG